MRHVEESVTELRITLNGSKPPIWRKLAVPSEMVLADLHEVIQIAMGWTDSHLHQFRLHDRGLKPSPQEMARRFQRDEWNDEFLGRMREERVFVAKVTSWGNPSDMEGEDEADFTLGELCPKVKSKLIYEYDFGDGWEHTIEVQKIIEPEPGVEYPVCLGGKKASPPEDCGGIWGYYELLETIADPSAEDHDDMVEWLGEGFDPDAFDLDEVNAILTEWRKDG